MRAEREEMRCSVYGVLTAFTENSSATDPTLKVYSKMLNDWASAIKVNRLPTVRIGDEVVLHSYLHAMHAKKNKAKLAIVEKSRVSQGRLPSEGQLPHCVLVT
ncbi:MAG: hypothetical protein ACE5L6_00475 [Candidatus Bathyarchaeia archaeon]